ncbi:MAG: zinc ribbon domain-containing protein [Rhodocyclaceae bacterium]|nr:zinc ribbon domain-containing protein [Rhodocyclaceae bacterium]
MPIYAYKCATCGHADDVMQKMSDEALTKCPACGAETYAKQVTAPNFALKGSGWYVTDFRGGNKSAEGAPTTEKAASTPASAAPDASTPAASPTPAPAASPAAAPSASPASTPSPN